MGLTRLALNNPLGVLMVCLAVVVLSGLATSRLPVDMFPGLDVPALSISTTWPGANPSEVETSITQPLEQAVSRVSGIVRVLSTSSMGGSQIQLWFDWGSNLDSSLVQVIAAVQRVQRTLPPGADPPSVGKFDVTNWPVVQIAVEAPALDPRKLYELGEYTLSPQLARIPGVAAVAIRGGKVRQINVQCDPLKLQARSLSLQDVQEALRANNQLVPSGMLTNPRLEYQLKIPTMVGDVKALEDVVVATRGGTQIKVRDLARVEDGFATVASTYRVNGRPGVGMLVYMQPEANLVRVVDDVKAAVPRLAGVPQGVSLKVVFDQSTYVRTAVRSLIDEGLFGALLVSMVVLVFLRNWKSVVIICISIPLSVASALVLLYFGHQTLNVFTLGGLTLALGRLVDDAIVVRENITRHLATHSGDIRAAVLAATSEVGMPVLASTLTTIAVFVPVIFLEGVSYRLFVPLALTIVLSMIASYFVSMTVDPVLSVAWNSSRPPAPATWASRLESALDRLEAGYQNLLDRALQRPTRTMLLLAALLMPAAFYLPRIPTEFFPESDEAVISVTLQSQLGASLERTESVLTEAERLVRSDLDDSELAGILSSGGLPSNSGRLFIRLVPAGERSRSSAQIAQAIRKLLSGKLPGVRVVVSLGGRVKGILNYGSPAPIDVQLRGYDQAQAAATAAELARIMATVPGVGDVQINPQGRVPALQVDIDRERAAVLGLNPVRVAGIINTAISGGTATNRYLDPQTGNEFRLVTQLDARYRLEPEDLASIPVGVLFSSVNLFQTGIGGDGMTNPGSSLTLRDVARIHLGSAPQQIRRINQVRVISLTANNTGALGEVSAGIQEALSQVKLPPEFSLFYSGQTEQQQRAFANMALAAALALMLVYMIMAAQFGTLWEPLVIMVTVPLGLVGVVWMQVWTGTAFSVMSFMGVIMMVGIVVSNGILLVEFAKTLRQRGLPLEQAVLQASRVRLRPILMTAIATIVGMIPMATGLGAGSQTNEPLARAVIGGLTVSTALTLLVVPLLYQSLARRLSR